MTGKELCVAFVGAAIVGGAAGFAATLAAATKDKSADAADAALTARLKSTEDELAKANARLDASKKTIDELSERVTKSEIALARRPDVASPAVPFPKTGQRVIRSGRRAADGKTDAAADDVSTALAGVDLSALPENVGVEIDKALDGIGAQIGGAGSQLESLRAGLDLRKLPEADRWQKAKDDLGLTWNQVEDLKKAVADRDAAMKDAANVEKKTSPTGGTITISRPDPAKTAHAQADYHDKVNAALNDEQRKNWQAKGYDHAFGKGGFGGAMVMTVDVAGEKDLFNPGKDANK